jgi:regulator of sigma E protease
MGILYIVLLLGGLIFFHELGHYLVARACGVHVVTFSIGFGPGVLKWRGKQRRAELPPTEYVLAPIPLGGYVRMLGHDPSEEVPDEIRDVSFAHQAVWKRVLIIAAGPVFNLVLPFLILIPLFAVLGQETQPATIGSVIPDKPAALARLRPGDRITHLDGEEVRYFWEIQDYVYPRPEEPIRVRLDRHGEVVETTVVPLRDIERHEPQSLGVTDERGILGITGTFLEAVVAPERGSIAAEAGLGPWDRVVSAAGAPIQRFDELERVLRDHADRPVELVVWSEHYAEPRQGLRLGTYQARRVTLPASPADPSRGIGTANLVIREVIPGSVADRMGLQARDRVIGLDASTGERHYASLAELLGAALAHPETEQRLVWVRDGKRTTEKLSLAEYPVPRRDPNAKHKVAFFGASTYAPKDEFADVPNERWLAYGFFRGWEDAVLGIRRTWAVLMGMFKGDVSTDELSGPLRIGMYAHKAAEYGLTYFFTLMALLSVSLGLINLLPIPIFDGGHLVFLALEGIRRRPVSLRTRQVATYIGLAVILLLFVIVMRNDIGHFIGRDEAGG